MAKYAEPGQQNLAKELTKQTGLYPGDLLMMASRGNLYPRLVDGDDEYTTFQPDLSEVNMPGARLPLAANQTIPITTNLIASWALPDFDDLSFWNPAQPTRLTIPNGVTRVSMVCGLVGTLPNNTGAAIFIRDQTGTVIADTISRSTTSFAGIAVTGQIAVTQGDWFDAGVFAFAAGTLLKIKHTYFAITVNKTTG